MSNSRRAGFVGVCCVVVFAAVQIADAASAPSGKKITTTQRLVILSSTGSKLTLVGTSDGKIARTGVRGAVRAVSIPGTPPRFSATGTLFYPAGTLRYKLTGTTMSKPGGSLSLKATGTFTGGTGTYVNAHGSFTGSGTKPANSFETFTLMGTVFYR